MTLFLGLITSLLVMAAILVAVAIDEEQFAGVQFLGTLTFYVCVAMAAWAGFLLYKSL